MGLPAPPADRRASKAELSPLKWRALFVFIALFGLLQAANWLTIHSWAPALNLLLLSSGVCLIAVASHLALFRLIENQQERLRRRALDVDLSEERLRISREMHDGVAQVLAYCNTKLQAVSEYLANNKIDEARQQLDELARTTREVYGDVREGLLGLSTVQLDDPLPEALRRYVELWQDQSDISVELEIEELFDVEPSQELQLLRIVQEALSNVRKHSGAHHARIVLRTEKDRHLVVVNDDGRGFDPASIRRAQFPRLGLATMKERAQSISGRLFVKSTPGHGTQVTVDLPRA